MRLVLFVDDEEEITESCVEYLKMEGYDAHGAMSVAQAMAFVEKKSPDTLIVDLNLKDKLTGLDLLKKALASNPALRGVVMTGHSEEDVEVRCREAGAKAVYRKPMPLEQLKKIVDDLWST